MEKIKEILKRLVSCPTVSGREGYEFKTINEIAAPYFDLIECDNVGNIVLTKHTLRLMRSSHIKQHI